MGFKGFMRSMAAAERRARREDERRQRALAKEQQRLAKLAAIDANADVVDQYNELIARLKGVHLNGSELCDWQAAMHLPCPTRPERSNQRERDAEAVFNAFKPGILDKLLGRAEAKRHALEAAILTARKEDEAEFREALEQYESEAFIVEVAPRVLEGDWEAYLQVLQRVSDFEMMGDAGQAFEFYEGEQGIALAVVKANSIDIIPTETMTLLASGKLSVKQMPASAYHQLYQDHICSAALRVAWEVMAVLPIESLIVTMEVPLLDSTTGYKVQRPIVSIFIPRSTLVELDFVHLDPSDAMRNFVHRMKFKKTIGFEPIDKLTPEDLNQMRERPRPA